MQFEQLCELLLELEGGVGAGAWVGEADRCRSVLSGTSLEPPLTGSVMAAPVLLQCAWIRSGDWNDLLDGVRALVWRRPEDFSVAAEVTAFQLSGASQPPAPPHTGQAVVEASLHLAGPLTDATGVDTPEGFLVMAGSRGRVHEVASMHEWLRNIRKGLIGQGILVVNGEELILTQDYVFDSPSSAAGVLLGRAANGRIEWKDAQGKTLKHMQIEALEQPADGVAALVEL